MAEVDIVKIEVTAPLPEEGAVDTTYRIEGSVKAFDAVGAPPWVYAEVQKKDWYLPDVVEETNYERGFPMPITGTFTIDWKPKKTGIYDVTVLATPAPISLPMIGVQPIVGKSDVMKVTISEKPAGEFKELNISSYDSVTPPGVLEVNPGDTIRVTSEFDYIGPAVSGKVYTALWHPSWYDPHDEIAHGEKSFSIPDSPEPGNHITALVDVKVPTGFAGTDFGLYSKLTGVPGPGVTSPYYENIITIVGVPPEEADIADFEFLLTKGTYDIGEKVPFTASYKYKGIAQAGQLTLSLGTGVYPSFFTKHTYSPTPVEFNEAVDWEERGLEGSITLPDVLEAGQTYSVRAKLETLTVKTQETDTDWSAFDITKAMETLEVWIDPVGAGYVTTSPAPSGGTQHNWLFPYGTEVYVTAHPYGDYVFYYWSGEMTDTPEITAPVYPMTEHRRITAHFKKVELPPSDIADWDLVAAGGTYDLGAAVPFEASYEYKGKAQSGWLTISLGTGVYPSFFTKYTFSRKAVSFAESMDWETGSLTGKFTLPATLERGQTYNVRAKLETIDGVQETDTDWGVITIEEAPELGLTDLTIVDNTQSGWIGSWINFTCMFKYVGPAKTGRVYITIGNQNTWFNEIWDSDWVEFPIDEAATKGTQITPRIRVPIPSGSPGKYDIYAKMDAPGIAEVFSPVYLNTITITL